MAEQTSMDRFGGCAPAPQRRRIACPLLQRALLPLLMAGVLCGSAVLADTPGKREQGKSQASQKEGADKQKEQQKELQEKQKKEFQDNKDIVQSLAGLVALLTGVVTLLPKALESMTLVSRRRRDLQRIDELSALSQKLQTQAVLSPDTSARVKQAIEAELLLSTEMLERTRQRRAVRAEDKNRSDLGFVRRLFLLFQPMCWRGIVAHWLAYVCVLFGLLVAYGLGQAWPEPKLLLQVESGTLNTGQSSREVTNASFQFSLPPSETHEVSKGTLRTGDQDHVLLVPQGKLTLASEAWSAWESPNVTGTLELPGGNLELKQASLSWEQDNSSFKWSEFMDYGGWLALAIGVCLGGMFWSWALRLHDKWHRANPHLDGQDLELDWVAKLTLGFRPRGLRAWLAHGIACSAALFGVSMGCLAFQDTYLTTEYLAISVGLVAWLAPWWLWVWLERWRSVQRVRSAALAASLQMAD